MGKRALVILGAGASGDLISLKVGRPTDQDLRPPLTFELFNERYSPILDRYPRARSLAAVVLDRLSRDEALEAIFRNLAESNEPHIVRQFQEMPLYLQELLHEVSAGFCSEPVNYSRLVNRLLASDFERVAFVTLNYDTLLDQALGTIDVRGKIFEMDGYVRDNWMLVKLHGSVNWGRKVMQPKKATGHLFRQFSEIALPPTVSPNDFAESPTAEYLANSFPKVLDILEDQVVFREGRSDSARRDGEDFYYPAITIPVEGKAGFSCPPEHVLSLQEFLPTCRNVLIIGVSGKDDDLLKLLKEHLPPCDTVSIVAHSESATSDAARRFNEVPPLAAAAKGGVHTEGFSTFVRQRGLEKFAELAVER